jgi:two-component system response regulator GlrR
MIGNHKRILLVDDDQEVLFVLQASLQRAGTPCDVIASYDGSKAYRLLQTEIFDLLVTAIRMPGIDGIALTALARSVSHTLPVVWITAHGCASLHDDAVRFGVYRCLEKPVEINVFRKVVQQALVEATSTGSLIPDGY